MTLTQNKKTNRIVNKIKSKNTILTNDIIIKKPEFNLGEISAKYDFEKIERLILLYYKNHTSTFLENLYFDINEKKFFITKGKSLLLFKNPDLFDVFYYYFQNKKTKIKLVSEYFPPYKKVIKNDTYKYFDIFFELTLKNLTDYKLDFVNNKIEPENIYFQFEVVDNLNLSIVNKNIFKENHNYFNYFEFYKIYKVLLSIYPILYKVNIGGIDDNDCLHIDNDNFTLLVMNYIVN